MNRLFFTAQVSQFELNIADFTDAFIVHNLDQFTNNGPVSSFTLSKLDLLFIYSKTSGNLLISYVQMVACAVQIS